MASSAKKIVFYYDIVCPYAYLGANRVMASIASTGARFEWQPTLLGGLYQATKAPQGKDGSATDVMAASKRALTARDLVRCAERDGVPLLWNSKHPVRSVEALRMIIAAPEAVRPKLSMRLYQAYWQDDEDVSDMKVLAAIGKQFGVDPDAIYTDEVKAELRANTDEAVSRGAFGVPSFWSPTAERLFWGQDRVHFALAAEGVAKADLPHLALQPKHDGIPRKLTFFHDFSSPWSYVASTQVERIARENGATVDYVPILVGALFKMIGTDNMPLLAMIEAKRSYMSRDLNDWCTWWGVDFNFPSTFPLRTVTPLRVSLLEPATIPAIYNAAWVADRNIGDPEVLAEVLTEAGFDAKSLIEGTQDQSVKKQLIANTERAVTAGACGVPTFQVEGGELIWGQDHFDVVEDMLRGWVSKDAEPAPSKSRL